MSFPFLKKRNTNKTVQPLRANVKKVQSKRPLTLPAWLSRLSESYNETTSQFNGYEFPLKLRTKRDPYCRITVGCLVLPKMA